VKYFDAEIVRDRLMARGAADAFVTDVGSILSVFFRDPDGLECEVRDDLRRTAHRGAGS
jgi:hypothetical protein